MTPAETILYAELTRANHDAPGLPIELSVAVKNAVLRAMERYADERALDNALDFALAHP